MVLELAALVNSLPPYAARATGDKGRGEGKCPALANKLKCGLCAVVETIPSYASLMLSIEFHHTSHPLLHRHHGSPYIYPLAFTSPPSFLQTSSDI